MIVVDSSVWIDHLRGIAKAPVIRLRALIGRQELIVGDLILCEVLRGVRSEAQASIVLAALRAFPIVPLADPGLAVKAAANYRLLRGRGITIRSTIDLIVGTFCIEHGHALLHGDRDFEAMERFLGLRTA
ncbi:MAG TPA: PIN domain nuclease [Stellaceae bacterium]|nr:PIN domain nuclease [Stellaceae bacterium]